MIEIIMSHLGKYCRTGLVSFPLRQEQRGQFLILSTT